MKIDINHIAGLARLKMDEQQAEKFASQMEGIIEMVANLPEIEGDATGLDVSNPMILREDKAEPWAAKRSELLANAPHVEAGCVVVPRVVE